MKTMIFNICAQRHPKSEYIVDRKNYYMENMWQADNIKNTLRQYCFEQTICFKVINKPYHAYLSYSLLNHSRCNWCLTLTKG